MQTIGIIDNENICGKVLSALMGGSSSTIRFISINGGDYSSSLQTMTQLDAVILGLNDQDERMCMTHMLYFKINHPKLPVIIYNPGKCFRILSRYFPNMTFGFISKEDELSELIRCLRTVLKGRRYFSALWKECHKEYELAEYMHFRAQDSVSAELEYDTAALLAMGLGISQAAQVVGSITEPKLTEKLEFQ